MPPAISVCLPVFNGSAYLREAIESVLNQSFEDFELVICDDGSADDSREIISQYASQDSRIIFSANEERCGLFGNYNRCLKKSSGKYIKPFAQDDVLFTGALKAMRQVFEEHPSVVLVSSASTLIGADGATSENCSALLPPSTIPRGQPVSGTLVISNSLAPVNNFIGEPVRVMLRKYVIGEGFDQEYRHLGDLDYWLRILRLGHYYFLNQDLCAFRKHPNSQTTANSRGMLFASDILRLAERFRSEAQEMGFSHDDYIARCIVQMGEHVAYLEKIGDLHESDVIQESLAGLDSPALNAAFRRLTFHSLKMIGKHELQANKVYGSHKINHLVRCRERALRNLLSSRSWRWTRVLREAKGRLRHNSSEESLLDAMEMQDNQIFRNMLYLRYMRKKILAIRASASWRVAAPLRLLRL